MVRLTINLSEERQRALKQAAAERGKTMGELVEESLEFYGVKTRQEAAALIRQARENAGLEEAEAVALGVEATRAVRGDSAQR
ncbi:ribbon-helix-helix domain-containing protein [Wenzhouxiangella sp. EGI_FJ10305]|uniref:CopG family transcriptional regulator n=1 Tax=Wenzhouxiangella sp. EGI_FJ10305 TaxID=3243768 RepID=UPI0035E08624